MKIRLPRGPSRPVLLVPAHGAHSLFRVLGRRGRFTVRPPRRRRRRRNHRCGAVAAPSKAFGTRVKVHREGAVEGKSVCAHKPYNLLHQLWQRPGKRTFYICLTSGRSYALHMSSVCCHACRHAWRCVWFTYGSHMFSIRWTTRFTYGFRLLSSLLIERKRTLPGCVAVQGFPSRRTRW